MYFDEQKKEIIFVSLEKGFENSRFALKKNLSLAKLAKILVSRRDTDNKRDNYKDEKVVQFISKAYREAYTEGPEAILMSQKQEALNIYGGSRKRNKRKQIYKEKFYKLERMKVASNGLNLYQFVQGNPFNSTDLLGLMKAGDNIKSKKNNEQTALIRFPDHEWGDSQKGWRLDVNRGDDSSLLESDEGRLPQHISEGINLALDKISAKLGVEITRDIFVVTQYDVLTVQKENSGKFTSTIFPVELKGQYTIKDNSENVGSYDLNINIDNPTDQNSEGPHGPHIGAEATGKGKFKGEKLHAHILLKQKDILDLQGLKDMPGRDRESSIQYETLYEAIKAAKGTKKIVKREHLFSAKGKRHHLNKTKSFSNSNLARDSRIIRMIGETFGFHGEQAKEFLKKFREDNSCKDLRVTKSFS